MKTILLALLPVLLITASWQAHAVVIIDNGAVDPTRITWNNIHGTHTIFDEFILTSATTITQIDYSTFMQTEADYTQTFISIWDSVGPGATEVITEFAASGIVAANGLTSMNQLVPAGFDVEISGLSMSLGPGTYFLGIGTDTVGFGNNSAGVTIGSGAGGADTVGPGLFQAVGTGIFGAELRAGDHFAFRLHAATPLAVPEPGSLALLAISLFGIGVSRYKRA